eukprot:scpid87495/ scgid0267/ Growth inhibition and differentiation-related protein 88; Putative mitochondrial space protein 32.1
MDAREVLVSAVNGICGVRARPLSQACAASRDKAAASPDFINSSFGPRPEKTAAVARRLISGALGVRVPVSKEDREKERQALHDARERKRDHAKRKADIWGDDETDLAT